jgi:hypothetical protein
MFRCVYQENAIFQQGTKYEKNKKNNEDYIIALTSYKLKKLNKTTL